MKKALIGLTLLLALSSCKREQVNQYVIDDQHVSGNSSNKISQKSDLQLISIAYSDLFGKQISPSELNVLIAGYNAVGDKGLIIDRVIRRMLSAQGIQKPTDSEMRADPDEFVKDCFRKFYVREPSELELWYFTKTINENGTIKPEDIYYVMMSAEEYRYY